jgi:ABC-2 type transport system permease protein
MLDALRLWGRYAGISLRGQMQYRASFMLSALGQFLGSGTEFAGLYALFSRFGQLREWTLWEVALFYGVVNVSFAFADSLSTGFDNFGTTIKQGDFDRLLLRPRSTVLQLAGQELALRRVGRLLQGAVVLAVASYALDLDWTLARVALLGAAVLGGICVFFALFVIQATIAFWTVESLEIMNTMTYGGVQTAQYPLSIYAAPFRRFFTFAVPLACVSYFPIVGVLGRSDPLGSPYWLQCVAPLAGLLFLLLALRFWKLGERHYTSTGS